MLDNMFQVHVHTSTVCPRSLSSFPQSRGAVHFLIDSSRVILHSELQKRYEKVYVGSRRREVLFRETQVEKQEMRVTTEGAGDSFDDVDDGGGKRRLDAKCMMLCTNSCAHVVCLS